MLYSNLSLARLITLPLMLVFSNAVLAAGESANSSFAICSACHALTADDEVPRIGPQLVGIIGRPAAAVDSFAYSSALQAQADAGLIWTTDKLDEFLAAPKEMIAETKMSFSGIGDASERIALIAWLESLGDAERGEPEAVPLDPDVEAILALEADAEFGQYLAGECVTCHQPGGSEGGVPQIDGLPAAHFVTALLDYKNGDRIHAIMQTMSSALGDEEMAALALYFSVPASP